MSLHCQIVDYDMGNLFSVEQACRAVGFEPRMVTEAAQIQAGELMILPGVGGFPQAMESLEKRGLIEAIRKHVEDGHFLLGICLGAQLLLDEGDEFGTRPGLGLIPGCVRSLREGLEEPLRVPHVGWAALERSEGHPSNALLKGVEANEEVYFVHSFAMCPERSEDVLCHATYEQVRFVAAIGRENILGYQFHPERSGRAGLCLLQNLKKHLNDSTA